MSLPLESARVAAWTSAFLAGAAAPDDLAEHAALAGQVHRVTGVGGAGPEVADSALSLPLAAAQLRRAGATAAWLVWPVAGDARGLPGPAEANRLVLAAGQGVVVDPGPGAADRSLCLVPSHLGDSAVVWSALAAGPADAARSDLADADRALKVAMRESTQALESLDVARLRDEDAGQVRHARVRTPPLELPPGFTPRARTLLDTAQRLASLLDVASRTDGAAVSRTEADERRRVLGQLARTVRHAFVASVNSLAEEHVRAR